MEKELGLIGVSLDVYDSHVLIKCLLHCEEVGHVVCASGCQSGVKDSVVPFSEVCSGEDDGCGTSVLPEDFVGDGETVISGDSSLGF